MLPLGTSVLGRKLKLLQHLCAGSETVGPGAHKAQETQHMVKHERKVYVLIHRWQYMQKNAR